jgi:two-component system, sensor histidine kinase and response regulator
MATILVVDDERPVREFLAHALEDQGHRVLRAFHGRHALSIVGIGGSERPDVVLADVMMPLVSGIELCRALKANPDTAGIPVVLMSAAAPRGALSAADGFIGKPFDLDDLETLLDRVMLANRLDHEHR